MDGACSALKGRFIAYAAACCRSKSNSRRACRIWFQLETVRALYLAWAFRRKTETRPSRSRFFETPILAPLVVSAGVTVVAEEVGLALALGIKSRRMGRGLPGGREPACDVIVGG